ncbi:hypothetical protein J5Y04_38900 [Kitasatospora sp. RG8]|uniref:hypothetical protein n=1 Tax=Kitasatospora sp. RG8 TaxID=2820815 RepID=UPI001ADF26B5|nr:hypothetical protein [Kitasatospora sp. RG8]MBP0455448.1 hypothetical protein [Kitasatospora sp. RG8]
MPSSERIHRIAVLAVPPGGAASVQQPGLGEDERAGAHPVDLIADRTGFGTPDSLRRHLLQRVGMTPRAYRARFSLTGRAARRPAARTP